MIDDELESGVRGLASPLEQLSISESNPGVEIVSVSLPCLLIVSEAATACLGPDIGADANAIKDGSTKSGEEVDDGTDGEVMNRHEVKLSK